MFETESIIKALEKSTRIKTHYFVVTEDGKLCGSFSDGDFRRWITNGDFDLSREMSEVMNQNVRYKKWMRHAMRLNRCFRMALTFCRWLMIIVVWSPLRCKAKRPDDWQTHYHGNLADLHYC